MKEQKCVTYRSDDGAYYNFTHDQGYNSISSNIRDGWRVVFMKDDPKEKVAMVVFEREIQDTSSSKHSVWGGHD